MDKAAIDKLLSEHRIPAGRWSASGADYTAREREQHLIDWKAWPGAVWHPWDAPPIGTRVRRPVARHYATGIVAGRNIEDTRDREHPDCPGCTCPKPRDRGSLWYFVPDEPLLLDGKATALLLLEFPECFLPEKES